MSVPLPTSPRMRLTELGVEALSDVELLTVLAKTGKAGMPASHHAAAILERAGGLAELVFGGESPPEVAVALELAKRATEQQLRQRDVFGSPGAVKNCLQLHLARKTSEEFAVLFLDAQNRLIQMRTMFTGTLTRTSVYPREIRCGCPGRGRGCGDPRAQPSKWNRAPSRADEALTQTQSGPRVVRRPRPGARDCGSGIRTIDGRERSPVKEGGAATSFFCAQTKHVRCRAEQCVEAGDQQHVGVRRGTASLTRNKSATSDRHLRSQYCCLLLRRMASSPRPRRAPPDVRFRPLADIPAESGPA